MHASSNTLNPHQLAPGTVLGEYRIERLLGRGGMGAVYQATHLTDGRIVAIKLLSVDLHQLDARQRFLREGQMAAAINHPNVVYIYGTAEIDSIPVIVMELVPGGTLEDVVRQRGPMSVNEAVESILQLIDGLDAAHHVGILHRDVKPSNCFVTTDGVAKIGDFGLSKPVDSIEQHKLTQTGLFLGSPVYSSPEQLLSESLDVRSDIYAVGVTFYYLLAGRLPYETGSLMQVMAAVLNGTPAPMNAGKVQVPPHVQQVVLKAMARHAKDRYQSYAEFRDAVEALRVPEFKAATLWERLRAYVVDTVPISYLVSALILLVYEWTGRTINPEEINKEYLLPLTTVGILLLTLALPEGLRGASFGKWLVGIRVVGQDGRPVGFPRSAARVLILQVGAFGILVVLNVVESKARVQVYTALVYIASVLLPFVTARPSNGWRMLHDVLTRSRVVRAMPRPRQRRADSVASGAPVRSGEEREIAQYLVTGSVPNHPGVLTGWDAVINRRVWVAPALLDGAELSQTRREVSRLTRLRWASGINQPGERWEVFEAPSGAPLDVRLQQPIAWHTERNWIQDLLLESRAAERDGSWPATAAIDQLWITTADEIVLTDVADLRHGGDGSSPQQLLSALAELMLTRHVGAPRPVHATQMLEKIRKAVSLEDIEAAFAEINSKPVELTRRRRVGPFIVVSAAALILGVFSNEAAVQKQRLDPPGELIGQLIDFRNDRRGCSFEHVDGVRFRRCLAGIPDGPPQGVTNKLRASTRSTWRWLGLPPLDRGIDGAPKDSATMLDERELAAVYVAHNLKARAQDSTIVNSSMSAAERREAVQLVSRYADADSATIRRATILVDSLWLGTTPNANSEFRLFLSYMITFVLLSGFGIFALIAALTVRRGLLLRAFQLEIVDRTGKRARRWRLMVRAVLAFGILLIPIAGMQIVRLEPASLHPPLLLTLFVLGMGTWVYGVVTIFRGISRGLPERLSGTWVVLE